MFLFLGNLYSQQQLGPVISGENAGDYFGENTAINIDGSIIAGFSLNNSNSKGHVRVFNYIPTGVTSWTQLGSDIEGKANNDSANIRNGSYNIFLNSAGNILAFGTERNDATTIIKTVAYQTEEESIEIDVENGTTYYWKIIAIETNQNQSSSGVYAFRTN